ncbi:hypothetical protein QYF36_011014 [Acer negundo]|nr:hypothetical protein QYF36_011014 [Acer negundo]
MVTLSELLDQSRPRDVIQIQISNIRTRVSNIKDHGSWTPKPTATASEVPKNQAVSASSETPQKSAPASPPVDPNKPAGVPGNNANNYFRADGQNCGNFLTDRPTTKVHAAPGGGSSLDYLFGGGGGK